MSNKLIHLGEYWVDGLGLHYPDENTKRLGVATVQVASRAAVNPDVGYDQLHDLQDVIVRKRAGSSTPSLRRCPETQMHSGINILRRTRWTTRLWRAPSICRCRTIGIQMPSPCEIRTSAFVGPLWIGLPMYSVARLLGLYTCIVLDSVANRRVD